jgi:hypothetical protein
MIVYLIGGGPSAGALDTAALKGGYRIGINDAAFHKPVDSFFSNDHGYALDIRDKILSLPVPVHLAIRQRFTHLFDDWPATIWTRRDDKEPCTRPGELSSGPAGTPGCSGYVALNLAAQFGASKIILFGYDFQDDYSYFFAGTYPRVRIPEVRDSLRAVASWYRRKGIEIFNANPQSAIDAFPRITHEEAFRIHENRSCHDDGKAGA